MAQIFNAEWDRLERAVSDLYASAESRIKYGDYDRYNHGTPWWGTPSAMWDTVDNGQMLSPPYGLAWAGVKRDMFDGLDAPVPAGAW